MFWQIGKFSAQSHKFSYICLEVAKLQMFPKICQDVLSFPKTITDTVLEMMLEVSAYGGRKSQKP